MTCPTCGKRGDAVMVYRPYCAQRCLPPGHRSGVSPEVAAVLEAARVAAASVFVVEAQ